MNLPFRPQKTHLPKPLFKEGLTQFPPSKGDQGGCSSRNTQRNISPNPSSKRGFPNFPLRRGIKGDVLPEKGDHGGCSTRKPKETSPQTPLQRGAYPISPFEGGPRGMFLAMILNPTHNIIQHPVKILFNINIRIAQHRYPERI